MGQCVSCVGWGEAGLHVRCLGWGRVKWGVGGAACEMSGVGQGEVGSG